MPAADKKPDSLFASPGKRSVVLCLLLVVVTLALYNSVTHHPFVNFDDDRYITDNYHVRAGLNWKTVEWAFTTYDEANWHPLTWLSHALDCQLFGLNPAGHHYGNVLIHAVNVVLLFLLLQSATGFTWRSLVVAALFALHPVNVESVAWIAERKNLLSMMFFLLALWSYQSYARKPGIERYLAVMALFACGLMAKPMVITFPLVLLLWDYWPLRRLWPEASSEERPFAAAPFSWLALEKVPLLVLTAGSAIVTMKAQQAGGAVRTVTEYPITVRLGNALVAYVRYVANAVWPVRLAPMYPHPGDSLRTWQVAGAAVFLLGATGLVLAARRKRYLATGWFLFLGTLVPMIGLVQVGAQAMADRYAYLPYLGLFVMLVWGIADWAGGKRLVPLAAASAAALIALSVLTYRQLGYWDDNVTLWTRTIAITGPNFIAQDNLGGALIAEGKVEEAVPHFYAAAAINPDDPMANLNIATNLQQKGELRQAVARYQAVLKMTSDVTLRARAFSNLGSAYRSLGQDADARQSYEAALRLVPETPHAAMGLGLLAQKSGNLREAAREYERAAAIQPTALNYLLLAQALRQSGHAAEAQAAYQSAQQLSPDLTQTQQVVNQLLGQ